MVWLKKVCAYSHVTNKQTSIEVFWFWKLLFPYRNQKGLLLSPIYKPLKSLFVYTKNKPATHKQLFLKQNERMNEEIRCITNKPKKVMNEWEHDDFYILWALHSVYK